MKKSNYYKNPILCFNTKILSFFYSGIIPLTVNIKPDFLNKRLVTVLCALFTLFTISAQPPMIRLQMSGPNNFIDETILYYQEGASLGFDSDFDAYKLAGPNSAPVIAMKYDNINFQVNGVGHVQQYLSMPVLVTSPQTNTYTIFATDFNDMPYGTCIKLVDTYNGNSIDIKNSDYMFVSYDTTSVPRFLLEISYMNMPVTVELKNADCLNLLGNFVAQGNGSGLWNYIWKDGDGNTLKTSLNTSLPDTLNPLRGGDYELYIENTLGCGYSFHQFTIDSIVLPTASFSSPDTFVLNSSDEFLALNTSVDAVSYLWSFGDQENETTVSLDGSHYYQESGEFVVELVAYNNYGCSDTSSKTVIVVDSSSTQNAVGLAENKNKSIKWCTIKENVYLVSNPEKTPYELWVYDISGKKVFSEKSRSPDQLVEFDNLTKGIYTVVIRTDGALYKTLCVVY